MDIIFIKELTIETIIGIYDWERAIKQPVVINLEMSTDVRRAAESDNIEDALNYKAVAKRIIHFVESSQFQLVETMAESITDIILTEFDVNWVKLELNKKGAIRGAKDVGVMIQRGDLN